MKAPDLSQVEGTTLLVAGGIALLAVVYIVRKGAAVAAIAKGALTGDNALTRGATNADGTPQTAYIGAGPAGTLGAATNAVSGGYLSTFGDWLGNGLYNLTHPGETAPNASDAAQQLQARPIDYGAPTNNPYGW